jgi:hypothetical protein
VGAGLLQTNRAVVSTVQIVPSSVSLGQTGEFNTPQTLTIYNTGASQVALSLSVTQNAGYTSSLSQVLVNNGSTATVNVPANSSATVTVTLTGGQPAAGRYEGVIGVTGERHPAGPRLHRVRRCGRGGNSLVRGVHQHE